MTWLIWAAILLIQNASFTWVSRARNSSSVSYHALAAVCSNGVWFLSQIVVISKITEALKSRSGWMLAATCLFYTVFTVIGSVTTHHFLMTKIESGKRKIGG